MYKRKEIETNEIVKILGELCDEYDYLDETYYIEVVEQNIDDLRHKIDELLENQIKYKLVTKYTGKEENSLELDYASFSLNITSWTDEDELQIKKYKSTKFTIEAGSSFYDDFIMRIAEFLQNYANAKKLQENLKELNESFKEAIIKCDNGINKVKNEYGERLQDDLEEHEDFDILLKSKDELYSIITVADVLVEAMQECIGSNSKEKEISNSTKKEVITLAASKLLNNELYKELKIKSSKQDKEMTTDDILDALAPIVDIIKEASEEIKFDKPKMGISFGIGEGFLDVSDEKVVIGLSEEVVKNLSNSALYDDSFEIRRENYTKLLEETIQECKRPYDILKVNSVVTQDLGIHSNEAIHNLIAKSVKRKIQTLRVGEGYYKKGDIFAVIKREAMNIRFIDKKIKKMNESDYKVIDNVDITEDEQKTSKNKILVEYKVKPFNIDTMEPVSISLSEILEDIAIIK